MTDPADKFAAYAAVRGLEGRCVIVPDRDELIDKVAAELTAFALGRVRERGVFHLALSGGSTPRALFRRLVIDPNYRLLPWLQTHVWVVDERCVPADDERSNFRMMREELLNHVPTPAGAIHPMPVDVPDGDRRYEDGLRETLPDDGELVPRLDCVLLGMGADGHTASLFPGTAALSERERLVVFNDGPTVAEPRPRLTMTFPLINAARSIMVLVMGESKRAAIQRVSLAGDDVDRLPITAVRPTHPDAALVWYLDQPAATGAPGPSA